jgi:hypothetical protein
MSTKLGNVTIVIDAMEESEHGQKALHSREHAYLPDNFVRLHT